MRGIIRVAMGWIDDNSWLCMVIIADWKMRIWISAMCRDADEESANYHISDLILPTTSST